MHLCITFIFIIHQPLQSYKYVDNNCICFYNVLMQYVGEELIKHCSPVLVIAAIINTDMLVFGELTTLHTYDQS
jgi:hypothetical protein